MIDIHIIQTPGFEENLVRQIEKLKHPAVNVWLVPYVKGDVLTARLNGYSKGVAPFVSFIDDDDEVLDISWIDDALKQLQDTRVSAVYPRWKCTRNGVLEYETPDAPWSLTEQFKNQGYPLAHHLTIMRRENVLKILNEAKEEVESLVREQDRLLLLAQARFGVLRSHPCMAYEWKLRKGSARYTPDPISKVYWVRDFNRETVRLAECNLST